MTAPVELRPPSLPAHWRILAAGHRTVAIAHSYPEALRMQDHHQYITRQPHTVHPVR